MTKKTRNILIATGVVATLLLGGLGYGVYRIYSFFSEISSIANREIPEELKEPRILSGGEFIAKTEFFKFEADGFLETVKKASSEPDEKKRQRVAQTAGTQRYGEFNDIEFLAGEVVAVGQFGAYFLRPDGTINRAVQFEPSVTKINVGPFEQDSYQSDVDNLKIFSPENGKIGFISHGSVQGVRVFNDNGDQMWEFGREEVDLSFLTESEKERDERYERDTHVLEAAAGDLDGDGVAEYIIALKKKGISAFDRNGTEKWNHPADFPGERLFVTDADGDGKNDVFRFGSRAGFLAGADGKVLRRIESTRSASFFVVKESKGNNLLQFCDVYDLKLTCVAEDLTVTFTGPAPLSEIALKNPRKTDVPGHPELSFEDKSDGTYKENGVLVTLKKDQPKYLAVIGSFIGIPRAHLYVYDEKGKLVYQELLPQNAEAIAVLPKADGTEDILVGGKNTIWRFSPK